MSDGDWSNIPRLVIASEFEDALPIASITIPAWPIVTTIIPLVILNNGVDIVRDAYPYVTNTYILESFGESNIPGAYIGDEFIIRQLETQPLPEVTAITSASSIQIVPLGTKIDFPTEFWG